MTENNPANPKQNIVKLTPGEHIRKRPGMYFGGTDKKALHRLVWEIVDISTVQAVQGKCNTIQVTLYDDNLISIEDDGAGIPVDFYQDTGKRILELVMSEIGRKYLDTGISSFTGGMFGVGLAAVNVVSEKLTVEVKRDGFLWRQDYSAGIPQNELQAVRALDSEEHSGTNISFKPDFSIFEPNNFDYATLYQGLREIAFLFTGLKLELTDRHSGKQKTVEFLYPNGLADYARHLNCDYQSLHEPITIKEIIELERNYKPTGKTAEIAVGMQYADTSQPAIISFVNMLDIEQGGTHIAGLLWGLDRAINDYAFKNGLVENQVYNFAESDLISGLSVVINIWHPEASFSGAIRRDIINPELETAVFHMVLTAFESFALEHPADMRKIVEKCVANKVLREQRRYGE